MASASFRESINSLGWSRRNTDYPVTTTPQPTGFLSKLQSFNPFGSDRGYVRLPTTEPQAAPAPARQDEEGWFGCESKIIPLSFSLSSCPSRFPIFVSRTNRTAPAGSAKRPVYVCRTDRSQDMCRPSLRRPHVALCLRAAMTPHHLRRLV
jgi:hypothetical protein